MQVVNVVNVNGMFCCEIEETRLSLSGDECSGKII